MCRGSDRSRNMKECLCGGSPEREKERSRQEKMRLEK